MFGTLVEDDGSGDGMKFAVRSRRRVQGYGGTVGVSLGRYGDTPNTQPTGTGNTSGDIIGAIGTGVGAIGTAIGTLFGQTPGTASGQPLPPQQAPVSWVPVAGIALAGAALFLVLSKKKKG